MKTHGGRIRVESDGPGLGVRFTFTLPAVEAARRSGYALVVTGHPEEAVRLMAEEYCAQLQRTKATVAATPKVD